MDDGGWTLGLATLALIGLGAFGFAAAVLDRPAKPTKPEPPAKPDFRAAMAKQATAAEQRRKIRCDVPSWDEWLDRAARRLVEHWPTVSYDAARAMIREYMADVATYPDPAFDWTLRTADETADEYMREYGEMHGANA